MPLLLVLCCISRGLCRQVNLAGSLGVLFQVWYDEAVSFMCLIGTSELEFVIGIAGCMDTYCATGEEPPSRE